jgi:hypothetical protein
MGYPSGMESGHHYVKSGTPQMAGLQRRQECLFTMDAAARSADEYRSLLHPRKGLRVHHVQRVLVPRAVQRHEI